ncbi:helix-turn-helix domain-containing protein [Methanosarcina acetivorans]|uniref:helix-turn-helix domain-containing protein n=1 Tax=Methanosarcina acetivorans TaxID=2214 RepID=UPI00247A62AE|nr:helix-turn-helix domain-containing protein [Methanosarcina acetivorans]
MKLPEKEKQIPKTILRSSMYPELVSKIKKLGLTENDVKIYIRLLITVDATAREIHELTYVP